VSDERDARRYLDALYGPALEIETGLIAVSTLVGKRMFTHTYASTVDALGAVFGVVNTFVRAPTLVRAPAPGRRGTVDLSSVLVALVGDLDVEPELAETIAHTVLPPSMLVASGRHAHSYWLMEPVRLTGMGELEQAKDLARGWHERLKREAAALGVALDACFTLDHLYRPVGSLHVKNGGQPRHVELAQISDLRYTVAQLTAEIDVDTVNGLRSRSSHGSRLAGDAPTVDALLEAFPKLRRIVQHKTRPPGDGTGHAWDFLLACEAWRSGCTRSDVVALVGHNRRVNADPAHKGDRADYVDRTIENAKLAVEARQTTGGGAAGDVDAAAAISARWGIQTPNPIVRGWSLGNVETGSAIMYLERASGAVLRIPRLSDLYQAAAHNRIISGLTRSRFKPLNPNEAVEITQLVVALCGGETADPHAEAEQWVSDFITALGVITCATLEGDLPSWDSLKVRAAAQAELAAGRDPRTVAMRDDRGQLWLPASPLKAHADARMDWDMFTTRLAEIAWRRIDVDRRPRRVKRTPGSGRIHTVFYVGHYDDDADAPGESEINPNACAGIDYAALRRER
jgi:hypothetical protein